MEHQNICSTSLTPTALATLQVHFGESNLSWVFEEHRWFQIPTAVSGGPQSYRAIGLGHRPFPEPPLPPHLRDLGLRKSASQSGDLSLYKHEPEGKTNLFCVVHHFFNCFIIPLPPPPLPAARLFF